MEEDLEDMRLRLEAAKESVALALASALASQYDVRLIGTSIECGAGASDPGEWKAWIDTFPRLTRLE